MNPFDSRPGIFDVAWRMFGISVRIKPSYWIFLGIFAWAMGLNDLWKIVAWVLASFLVTMIDKLAQVIVGRLFGYPGGIVLMAMGGGVVAEYARAPRWQRIVINASGLLASVALLVGLIVISPFVTSRLAFFRQWESFAYDLLCYLIFFALFDLLVDALPILPNSAGQIVTDLLGYVVGKRDFICGTLVSVLVAGGVIGYSIYKHYHPQAPFIAALSRSIVGLIEDPFKVPNLLGGGDSSPLFIACLFGLSLIYNVSNLFFKKR